MFKIEITFLYDMKNNFSIMAFLKILKINPKSGYTGLFHASSLFIFYFLCVCDSSVIRSFVHCTS